MTGQAGKEERGRVIGSMDENGARPVRAAGPLRPIPLVLSVGAIVLAAVLFACVAAAAALAGHVALYGREATTEMLQDLRFDPPLKTQVSALVVTSLYCGVALATLAAAILRGRRRWASLLALGPVRNWIETLLIVGATLGYAATATILGERARDHRLLLSGPTDLTLLGTIVANLVLLAPLAEELLFRGWLYTGLRQAFSFWPSFVAVVALFAAIHGEQDPHRIIQVLPLAVALGLLRERAGGIKPTLLLHGAYNFLIVAIHLVYV